MRGNFRSLFCASVCLALSACGGSSSDIIDQGSATGGAAVTAPAAGSTAPSGFSPPPAPVTTDNAVVATPSTASVAAAVGGSRTVSIAFTSNDGQPMTGFEISNTLGALPAGWSGPKVFACAGVSTGSDCVLDLSYSPTTAGSGTLTIGYVVIDAAGLPQTDGTLTLAYTAEPGNHVVAAASPVGQIDAGAAMTTAVTVNFSTDDGNPATNLAVTTDLGMLPAGWSSSEASFGCAIVSTGSGCQLALTLAAAAGGGILVLNYGYVDAAGAARTGTLSIPYATPSGNVVVAGASPPGQIVAAEKSGSQPVTVTFTTDDGKPASQLFLTTDLGALPAGWSAGANGLACAAVATGNGCRLQLDFAPAALGAGTLTLNYVYTDGAGAPRTGTFDLAYAATTNDNVVATASPGGPIDTVVGTGAVPVTVAFTTDDGRAATALQVTTDLSMLPAGWSAATVPFGCAGIDAESTCTLPLTYQPVAAANGTATLHYAYRNNAGEAKSGTLNVGYRATTDDAVVGLPNPGSLSVLTGSSTQVTITFATDDGNPASALSMGGSLAALPAGWSAATPGFTCATISSGTACVLSLNFAPLGAEAGTLTLPFGYSNDSGFVKTGAVSIPYAAAPPPPPSS